MNRVQNWMHFGSNNITLNQWVLLLLFNALIIMIRRATGIEDSWLAWILSSVLAAVMLMTYKVYLHNHQPAPVEK